ncbi:MAG: hypothetical protein WA131_08260 [Desulfitobacteriaceae bacterium]
MEAYDRPDSQVELDAKFTMLTLREQQALSAILISSKSLSGLNKKDTMRYSRVRTDEQFDRFLEKANYILGHALKLVYDEESDRCIALTRASSSYIQEMLDEKQLALLLFCFYLGITSRTKTITFDELNQYFQRSTLRAERRLLLALDHLCKCGFLRMEEVGQEGADEKKRVYHLTNIARNAFPEKYLLRLTEVSQGGEVSMEQIHNFFALNQVQPKEEEFVQVQLF